MVKLISTELSGVSHGDCQDNIKQFGCEDIGSYALIRELDTDFGEQILNTIEEKKQLVLLIQTYYRNLKHVDDDLTKAGAL